jgi:intracellular sulfur oxidation DsrE/DsrF family protein
MNRLIKAFLGVSLLTLGWSLAKASGSSADTGVQKVVYQNNGGLPDNPTYFRRLLASLQNHVDAVGPERADIRVVSFASGLELFVAARADALLSAQIDALRVLGVRFVICGASLKTHEMNVGQLYGVTETDLVPSGVAEIARLQADGYSYIRL